MKFSLLGLITSTLCFTTLRVCHADVSLPALAPNEHIELSQAITNNSSLQEIDRALERACEKGKESSSYIPSLTEIRWGNCQIRGERWILSNLLNSVPENKNQIRFDILGLVEEACLSGFKTEKDPSQNDYTFPDSADQYSCLDSVYLSTLQSQPLSRISYIPFIVAQKWKVSKSLTLWLDNRGDIQVRSHREPWQISESIQRVMESEKEQISRFSERKNGNEAQ